MLFITCRHVRNVVCLQRSRRWSQTVSVVAQSPESVRGAAAATGRSSWSVRSRHGSDELTEQAASARRGETELWTSGSHRPWEEVSCFQQVSKPKQMELRLSKRGINLGYYASRFRVVVRSLAAFLSVQMQETELRLQPTPDLQLSAKAQQVRTKTCCFLIPVNNLLISSFFLNTDSGNVGGHVQQ